MKNTTVIKSTETARQGFQFTKKMYARAREAQEKGTPVVWSMFGAWVPEIVLPAMDVTVIYPENYGAAAAAKQVNIPLLETCEADGFSPFICGYARTGIGFALRAQQHGGIPPDAPLGGMAKPLALIGCSLLCDARYKWFQSLGRYVDAPCYCFDNVHPSPTANHPEIRDCYLRYQAEEIRALVAFLEKRLGRKMDESRLNQAIDTALETHRIWHQCHELRKAVPCPMPSEDVWATMVPFYFMPTEKESLEFCQKLYAELKGRVENKVGAIPNEKYRLLFAELPPWHTLQLLNYLEDLGAISVIESFFYYPSSPPDIPANIRDPYLRLAYWSYQWWQRPRERACGEAELYPVQQYLEWAREYQCDGALLHALLSCRSATIGHAHARNVLLQHAKIPSLMIQSDIVDKRTFSEAEVKHQAEAFIEVMDNYKSIRQKEGMPVAHPLD